MTIQDPQSSKGRKQAGKKLRLQKGTIFHCFLHMRLSRKIERRKLPREWTKKHRKQWTEDPSQ